MALQMKTHCERCPSVLEPTGEAYICTYECTFCRDCAFALHCICPKCEGELVRRPRRGKVLPDVRFEREAPATA